MGRGTGGDTILDRPLASKGTAEKYYYTPARPDD